MLTDYIKTHRVPAWMVDKYKPEDWSYIVTEMERLDIGLDPYSIYVELNPSLRAYIYGVTHHKVVSGDHLLIPYFESRNYGVKFNP